MSLPLLLIRRTTNNTTTLRTTAAILASTTTIPTIFKPRTLQQARAMSSASTIYDFTATKQLGEPLPMSQLKGKVVLIVNVASKCGFTPQYKGLEELNQKYHDKGLEILGFPCNQFGGQEPGTDEDIQNFCQTNYGVKFTMMKKVDVNGEAADPLWEHIKNEKPGMLGMKRVKWNYEKFLIGRDGKVVERWASVTKPESLAGAIERELAKGAPVS
ncbi:thioredoxin-like protein [Tricharina praecox]|uniref:thioredoxin-like protein n=1 Tax=Tricharina praecox TaxID=43433 RepID=UPI0022203678|nr:thioredoxin-like protein [Tricharina praecox]KAI5853992.1 thioredoxin-like protein [Tricharina praecox]